eukprot:10777439-Ditylum_brightwellii.AAC.1
MRLPIRFQGCGLQELEDRCFAEYLGSMWHGLPPLLDSTDEEGSHVSGRLKVPALVNLFCQNSFGSDHPWQTLLAHQRSNLAQDLQT